MIAVQLMQTAFVNQGTSQRFILWAGATIPSLNRKENYLPIQNLNENRFSAYTTKWVDANGMQLTLSSEQWCDPTVHTGYTSQKEPTSETRKSKIINNEIIDFLIFFCIATNSTEREECVTYIVGTTGINLLCLADDYCSQKYPFICEMNAASMKLANSVIHGMFNNSEKLI
jgi:hypothetical protein